VTMIGATSDQLKDLLQRTSVRRQGTAELSQLHGLYWGLGTVAVASVFGFLVWRGRGRRRGRR